MNRETQDQARQHDAVPTPLPWHHEIRRDAKVAVRTRKQVEEELIRRALKDSAFRQALIADPRGAAEAALGIALPAGVALTVLEESDAVLHLVLPAFPHPGISEASLVESTRLTYEDVAECLVEEQAVPLLPAAMMTALLARTWRDADFTSALIADARGTIEREYGLHFAGEARVDVFVESERAAALVLPTVVDTAVPQEAWQEQEDELLVNILASPCNNSHPDPCCTASRISL